jgi:hypothetical protein
MFVYYYVHVGKPFPDVERSVLALVAGFGEFADAAYREAEEIRVRLGTNQRPLLAKTVRLDAGEPVRGATQTSIPITWEATGTPGLFPTMEAEVVVAALGPAMTQVSLRGSYTPPLGAVGRALDRTLLHRISEASVKSFVDRIAAAIDHGAVERFERRAHAGG